jgi:hypothetical protein
MDYKQETFQIIAESELLTQEQYLELFALGEEMVDVFLHSQRFRTRTEMEVSVLDNIHYPTPDSKYWQSVREQNGMFENLVYGSYEYRKLRVELQILERDIHNEPDPLKKELIQVEIERKRFELMLKKREAVDRLRELKEWHEIKDSLLPDLKCSTADCDEHQLVSYTQRWVKQFIAMGDGGSPGERWNLFGQLQSGLKACEKKGILAKVLIPLGDNVIFQLKERKLIGNVVK